MQKTVWRNKKIESGFTDKGKERMWFLAKHAGKSSTLEINVKDRCGLEDCNRKTERKQFCTVLFSSEGMCGHNLKVKKTTEKEDEYPKNCTRYDPNVEHEKKRRLVTQQQLKQQGGVPKYLEVTRL